MGQAQTAAHAGAKFGVVELELHNAYIVPVISPFEGIMA